MKRLPALVLPILFAGCVGTETPADPAKSSPDAVAVPNPALSAPALAQTAPAPEPLAGRQWKLLQASDANGKRIAALFAQADRPLQVEFARGRMAVTNACNPLYGKYRRNGDVLELEALASTMKKCHDPERIALDLEVKQRLTGKLSSSLTGNDKPRMTLRNAAGDALVFLAAPIVPRRYTGTAQEIVLEVAAMTKRCNDPEIPDYQCLQVREVAPEKAGDAANGKDRSGDTGFDRFLNFYGDIEGYTHVPGVGSVLRIHRRKLADAPVGGPSSVYILDAVLETRPASAQAD
ncbi:META and DUF4377 domain-containing protein [Thermomonas carbonis]|uniref:META and DUF4377 domain-containing protein n=1 Tax=Thermomonas carbonis TaxID=1463158 RepID=A0A7G9ST98_9GAMM|nr:META and DUF4377 domain-containing protein [Thermomonas carbonis]QNN71073.1 META and DUF4377 domain-containing protein [Thermomonas carbonis]GHC04405.1 hypothetical protein GCM10010080_18530 [Thermomonas carbonis]